MFGSGGGSGYKFWDTAGSVMTGVDMGPEISLVGFGGLDKTRECA